MVKDTYPEMTETSGEIDLTELHDYLWKWYNEGYVGRELDLNMREEKSSLQDCLFIINKLREGTVESEPQNINRDASSEVETPDGKIDLDELHSYLWSWYFMDYGRGDLDTLTREQARSLYDCMVVVGRVKRGLVKSGVQRIRINDTSQRP